MLFFAAMLRGTRLQTSLGSEMTRKSKSVELSKIVNSAKMVSMEWSASLAREMYISKEVYLFVPRPTQRTLVLINAWRRTVKERLLLRPI